MSDRWFSVFQVPEDPSPVPVTAVINVNVRCDSGILNKKAKVLISPPVFIHVVQTDKPIYKPGQTGRCGATAQVWRLETLCCRDHY